MSGEQSKRGYLMFFDTCERAADPAVIPASLLSSTSPCVRPFALNIRTIERKSERKDLCDE